MIKVLVADDHAVVRRGLRQILTEAGDIHVGGEAATASDTLALLREQRWDVVILDVSLQGGNGIDLLGDIKADGTRVPVLILTVHSEDQYAVRAIRAGAAGFLTKDSAPEHLVEAVRRLASGGRYLSAAAAEKLASFVSSDRKEPHELLSDREFEILKLIGSGNTVSQIASGLSLSVKTISTHRTRILKKMSMSTNAELATYAIRKGLV